MPNATFLAFTGTPISKDDRDTQAVFGEYVDIYDIQQAVEDGATVPIYYESRLAKIEINQDKLNNIDHEVEEIFEDGIEDDVLGMVRERKRIKDYFLLDVEMPYIYSATKKGERNIAIRYSEYENIFLAKLCYLNHNLN